MSKEEFQEVKKTLLKQLQLLSERSEKDGYLEDLPSLTDAMVAISAELRLFVHERIS